MAEGIMGGYLDAEQSRVRNQLLQDAHQDWLTTQAGNALADQFIRSLGGGPQPGYQPYGGVPPPMPQGGGGGALPGRPPPPMPSGGPAAAVPPTPTGMPGQQAFGPQPPPGAIPPGAGSPMQAPPRYPIQPASYNPSGPPGAPPSMPQFIRQVAQQPGVGVDPNTAVSVAQSEGMGPQGQSLGAGDQGQSGGPFQLYTGGGLGNTFQGQTGQSPLDPKQDYASAQWAVQNAPRTGWGPYHGAARVGIGPRQGLPPQPTGGAPMAPWGGQPGGPGAPPGPPGGPGGLPGMDLETLADRLTRANAGRPMPPGALLAAMSKLAPIMAPESRLQLMYLKTWADMQRQEQKDTAAGQRQEQKDVAAGERQTQKDVAAAGRQVTGAELKKEVQAEGEAQKQTGRMAIQRLKGEQAREMQAAKADTAKVLVDYREANQEKLAKAKNELKVEVTAKPTLTDKAVDLNARQTLLTGQAPNLGTGVAASANKAAIANRVAEIAVEENVSPQQLVNAQVALVGEKQAARTANLIGVRIDEATREVRQLLPITQASVAKMDLKGLRSRFPDLNTLVNTADEKIGDPDIVQLKANLVALAGAWGSVITRGYIPRKDAFEVGMSSLNAAYSSGQMAGVFKALDAETGALENSSQGLIQDVRSGKWGQFSSATGAGAPAAPSGGGDKRIGDDVRGALQEQFKAMVVQGSSPQDALGGIVDSLRQQGYRESEIKEIEKSLIPPASPPARLRPQEQTGGGTVFY